VLAAAGTDDETGEEERRGCRGPLGVVLAALGQKCLDPLEELVVDEVGVRAVVEGSSRKKTLPT
jgi:hypothetical protein